MESLNWVHVTMCATLYGIHYPVAQAYVYWTLRRISNDSRDELLARLRPRLRLLLGAWLSVIAACIIAVAVSTDRNEVLKFLAISAIGGFHAIWWPFVVPIFSRMQLELQRLGLSRTTFPAGPVRTAELKPRRASNYLRPWMRALPVAVGSAGVGAITWRLALHPPSEVRFWIMIGAFTMSGVFFLFAWSLWVRREISQSYLADAPSASARDRIASAESLRRYRVSTIYWLQIAAALFFFTIAFLIIETDRGVIQERWVGIIGGVGGGVLGVAGAVLGFIAGIWAHRIQRRASPPRQSA